MAASTPIPNTDGQLTRGKLDPAIEVKVFDREKVWPGTTLLNDNHDEDWPRIIEVNMLGEVVWEYVISKDLWDGEPFRAMDKDVESLPNGNILFGLPNRGIFEINRDGEVVWSHLDENISHDVDRLPNGNTLYNFGAGDNVELEWLPSSTLLGANVCSCTQFTRFIHNAFHSPHLTQRIHVMQAQSDLKSSP